MYKHIKEKFPHNKFLLTIYGIFSLYIFLYVFQPAYNKHDPDTFWHLSLGNWMLQHGNIVNTSINSFNEHLNYVPHEVLFQITISFIYHHFSWIGLHVFSVFWLGILIWGLYKLCFTSMEEFAIQKFHPYMHFLILLFVNFIYIMYMPLRPQMVSGPLTVWYFIWILKFRKDPTIKKGLVLGLFSLFISNVHGGIWPLLLIFYGIAIIELVVQRRKSYKAYSFTLLFILLGGFLNAGGWKTNFYIFLLMNDPLTKSVNMEWQSVNFFENKVFLIIFVLILYGLIRLKTKNIFTILIAIVITIFSVLSYKHAYYGLLLLLYILPDGGITFKQSIFTVHKKHFYPIIAFSLLLFLISGFYKPYIEPVSSYPVKEMNYVLQVGKQHKKVKVLTDFTASAYANFRGASILADGRWDPFITKESRQGKNHLNAIERSMYIFGLSPNIHLLKEEISLSKPDYLIYKNSRSNPLIKTNVQDINNLLGKPVFKGDYGYVWAVTNRKF
jgi:hypothetical protein